MKIAWIFVLLVGVVVAAEVEKVVQEDVADKEGVSDTEDVNLMADGGYPYGSQKSRGYQQPQQHQKRGSYPPPPPKQQQYGGYPPQQHGGYYPQHEIACEETFSPIIKHNPSPTQSFGFGVNARAPSYRPRITYEISTFADVMPVTKVRCHKKHELVWHQDYYGNWEQYYKPKDICKPEIVHVCTKTGKEAHFKCDGHYGVKVHCPEIKPVSITVPAPCADDCGPAPQ